MPSSSVPARRRAPGSARTPLHDLASAAGASLGSASRRTVVAAGASGLLVSLLSGAAAGEPRSDHTSLPVVDASSLTAAARAALRTSPVVQVPVEAAWTFEAPVMTVVADPPPTPPPPPPVTEEPAPSRSAEREAAPAAEIGSPVPASANGSAIIEVAARYVGTPYRYGGTTPDGFDCSGFTSYVFAQVGISLPRTSGDQRYAGVEVPRDQAQPGDLIWSPGHISIYAGGDQQIDSPQPGGTVQFRSIYQSDPVFIRVG